MEGETAAVATYIWVDGTGHLRSKYRTLILTRSVHVVDAPEWEVDGTPMGVSGEFKLIPVRIVPDPFSESGNDIIVLCETFTRMNASTILLSGADQHPWFGFKQDYLLCDGLTSRPLRWADVYSEQHPAKQGASFCGIGHPHVIGRSIAMRHYKLCMKAGLSMWGLCAGTVPSQWQFQLGPMQGIRAADELMIARYILEMVCEEQNVRPVFHPKPKKQFSGSGCVVTYSNDLTRQSDGLSNIFLAIQSLSERHAQDVALYGKDNHLRLGDLMHEFTFGVDDRSACVRIPSAVFVDKKGYFEDRRPGANCDPYVVIGCIHEAVVHLRV